MFSQGKSILTHNPTHAKGATKDSRLILLMFSTLVWHWPGPKQRENKCTWLNTKHTAIRCVYSTYIFIFRYRQANCQEVFLCFHGIFDLFFVHTMHYYTLVLQVQIDIQENFYTLCALCIKIIACSFHTSLLHSLKEFYPNHVLWEEASLVIS